MVVAVQSWKGRRSFKWSFLLLIALLGTIFTALIFGSIQILEERRRFLRMSRMLKQPSKSKPKAGTVEAGEEGIEANVTSMRSWMSRMLKQPSKSKPKAGTVEAGEEGIEANVTSMRSCIAYPSIGHDLCLVNSSEGHLHATFAQHIRKAAPKWGNKTFFEPSGFDPKRLAIISSGDEHGFQKFVQASLNKICYAALFGYSIVLHWGPVPGEIDLNPWWRKVDVLLLFLPFFDWLMWMDQDTIFVNLSVPITHFMRQDPHGEPWRNVSLDIVMTDHNENINNGVSIYRRSRWTLDFVQKWREMGKNYTSQGVRGWWDDQGLMWGEILHAEYTAQNRLSEYQRNCSRKEPWTDGWALLGCFMTNLNSLGSPYRQRKVQHFRFIDPVHYHVPNLSHPVNGWIRGGFDQYAKHDVAEWATANWTPENWLQDGDFVMHMGSEKNTPQEVWQSMSSSKYNCWT